jgi:dTDP-4-dehydrorhamnose reductase
MSAPILLFGATSIPGFNLVRLFPQSMQPFVPPHGKSPWPALNLEDPAWPELAYEINVCHVQRLLDTLPVSTRLVYVSSDHVFGGNGTYNEESTPCPISVYGRTRVAAEKLVLARERSLVLRTGLAIGPSHNGRTGHIDWLAYRHQHHLPITIIEDEFRSAVWVDDLAARIMDLAQSEETGLRHIAATRAVSRVELAEYLAQHLGIDTVFKIASRHQQPAPHLGRVELATIYQGELYQLLASVVDL